jgi:hypothetical protein
VNQIELEPETRAVLDRIRHSSKVLSIYEMPADLAEAAVWEIGKVLVDHQHLPMIQQHSYRWFLREVSKLLRTKTGWDLALELEICLRKWVGYNVNPLLMQALLRECCDRIAAMTPEDIEENPKLETRMTNQARNPNGRPRKHEGHEEATDEVRSEKPDAGSQKPGPGEELTTKTPRHKVEERPTSEVRRQNAEGRSADGGGISTDYADSADCVPASGTNNEERCTMNEEATAGGASG